MDSDTEIRAAANQRDRLDGVMSDSGSGSPISNIKSCVAPGTRSQVLIGYLGLGVFALVTTAVTWGAAAIGWIAAWILSGVNQKKQEAIIRGSAVAIDDDQFPGIQERTARLAELVGLKSTPDVYMIESNEQNAAATNIGRKNLIVLIDDMVYGALQTQNPDVLDFVIAHELAHLKLGHTKPIRSTIRQVNKRLSRLDEFSCDAVAAAVVGKKAAFDAFSLMVTGPQLFPKINTRSIVEQATEVGANRYSAKAEKKLTHPLPLRRLARIMNPKLKP